MIPPEKEMIPPEQKAIDLVDSFRIILMDDDTDCSNELLCTTIAIKHAIIVTHEVINAIDVYSLFEIEYWETVKKELEKM